jgi:uncharacterized phage protein (TIGR02218 family)
MADCYSLTLADGTVVRYTSADRDITDQATGHVFSASGPLFQRSQVKFSVGVQVDELDITVYPKPADLLDGMPWFSALRTGVLDGAELQLDRAFMSTFGDTSAGLLTLFSGRIVEVDLGRTKASIKANTHLELLNLQWPWRLFQPGCARTLFDAGCGLNKSSFGIAATAQGGATVRLLNVTGPSQPAGYFSLGTGLFTSGTMAGKKFAIKLSQVSGATTGIHPLVPFPVAPAANDMLTLYPGCDKLQATCKDKFGNLQNFEGFPYVPVPETAA